jgi:beta-ribofuranosylaminobenzene 5'-phosphate synthase
MMSSIVHVRAPCRLHFGMFSFGHADRPQFGGVGMMVDPPAIEVTIAPATQFRATGALSDRVIQIVQATVASWNLSGLPACEIAVHSPRDHVGLGVGTQLSLAIAHGLRRFLNLPERPVEQLAQDVGRGGRSAVGTYGFKHGGLIVDAGHLPGEPLGKLVQTGAVPESWRIVLARRAEQRGLAGRIESDAFLRLPPVPEEVTQQLRHLVHSDMIPTLERRECQAFGESVYRFGRLAGECFAAVQGGPFASSEIAQLIHAIRKHGVSGVGQSSWGPTIFAICESEAKAVSLRDWLGSRTGHASEYDLTIASPNNNGARIDPT